MKIGRPVLGIGAGAQPGVIAAMGRPPRGGDLAARWVTAAADLGA
jgi:hypothetical protein